MNGRKLHHVIWSVTLPMLLAALVLAAALHLPASADSQALSGIWVDYSAGNDVSTLAVDPRTQEVWVGTSGGLVRWDSHLGTYTKYTVLDGLAANQVNAIAIDADGNRWFGTEGLVTRLSNTGDWTIFNQNGAANTVRAIVIDGSGNKWFGTARHGLYRLGSDGVWTHYTFPGGDDPAILETLAFDHAGNLWVGTHESGIGVLAPNYEWRAFTVQSNPSLFSNRISAIAVDGGGDIWISSDGGLNRVQSDGQWVPCSAEDSCQRDDLGIMAIDENDNKWFWGTFLLDRNGHWVDFPDISQKNLGVTAFVIDTLKNKWYGTRSGLHRLTVDNEWRRYATADFLASNWVQAAAVDRQGGKWFGTWDGGVSRLAAGGEWATYLPQQPGLVSDPVFAIAVDAQSNKWFATDSGVSRLAADNHTWEHFDSSNSALESDVVQAIAIDADGNRWFGTEAGAARLSADSGTWITYTAQNSGLAADSVRAIGLGADGSLWFGTQLGVSRLFKNGAWATYTKANSGLLADDVIAIAAAGNDVWIGVDGGVSHFALDTEAWTSYTSNNSVIDNDVQAIAIDGQGNTWFGVYYGGVVRRASSGQMTKYVTADGLGNGNVHAVALDARGSAWFGTDSGAARYTTEPDDSPCPNAVTLEAGSEAGGEIESAGDGRLYSMRVDQPYSRLEVTVPDALGQLDLNLYRSCDAIGKARYIGKARFIGSSQELRLVFDVGTETGTYYVQLLPTPEAQAFPIPYRLRVGLTLIDPDDVYTLILTNKPRVQALFGLNAGDPELASWERGLAELAEVVGGQIVWNVQLDTKDQAVESAYTAWLADPGDPAKANAAALALHDWIWVQKQALPHLRYIVLAGDDRILPQLRVSIVPMDSTADWAREPDYLAWLPSGAIAAGSPIGKALAGDFTLSDDVYGAKVPAAWSGGGLYIPELPVGRLVERPAHMTAVIDAFLQSGGVLTITNSLVAGYDFMQDAAAIADNYLKEAGLLDGKRSQLLQNQSRWDAGALRTQLFETRKPLALLALHASHYSYDTPTNEVIESDEVASAGADLSGTLIYALACHGGLNVSDISDARPFDFAEAWLSRGATLVGSTGWAYGYTGATAYQERLMADFVQALVAGDGASVGDALVRTKQNYYLAHTMDKFHAKTLAETVLYGLPMVHVHVAGDVQARLPASIVSASPMQSLVRQTTEEMRRTASYAVVRATYAFNVKGDAFQLTTTPDGQYYTYWGQPPYTESREWIQPKAVLALGEANLSGMIVEPHGAVFLGGTSHDVPFTPLAGRAGILGVPAPAALQPASLAANSEWYPPMRVDLHRLERADGAGTVLFGSSWAQLQFTLGQYDPHSATERLYDEVIVDEYFSNSPDYTSPTVESIDVQRTGATVTLMVQAGDASGISQVVVAYRGPGGTWWTIELVPDSAGGWTGTAAPAERYIVQVVDQGGNVAVEAVQGPQEQAVYFPFVKR